MIVIRCLSYTNTAAATTAAAAKSKYMIVVHVNNDRKEISPFFPVYCGILLWILLN